MSLIEYNMIKTPFKRGYGNRRFFLFILLLLAFVIFSLVVIQFCSDVSQIVDRRDKSDLFIKESTTFQGDTKLHTKLNNEYDIETEDETDVNRVEKIKKMMLVAWHGYKKFAWGKNELRPINKSSFSISYLDDPEYGLTIIESLDTLFMMDFKEEFLFGCDWILKNFTLNYNFTYGLSGFELNTKLVGSFLSLYSLTQDKSFLIKAREVANILLPLFDSPTGLPYSKINPKTGKVINNTCTYLSDIGGYGLEFHYLSDLSKQNIFKQKAENVLRVLNSTKKEKGLYYDSLSIVEKNYWCSKQANVGLTSNVFYEYLLKLWLYKNKKDNYLLETYLNAIRSIKQKLIRELPNGLVLTGLYAYEYVSPVMHHSDCSTAGIFALSVIFIESLSHKERSEFEVLAKKIAKTCHESYVTSNTKLGPESFNFDDNNKPVAFDKGFMLEADAIEAYFYLWRMTKEQKYRDWAWEIVEALEKYSKTQNGYSGILDVTVNNISDIKSDDVQPSYFLAKTLKYLFLIFSDRNVLRLDRYVINNGGHPFFINLFLD